MIKIMESFCRCFTNKLPTNQAQYFSICHPFLGDYVRLRQNPQWKKMCSDTNDQYVVFADIINKITRTGGKVMVHKHWLCHVHILDSPSSFSALNPIFVGGGLIAPAVWKTSSSGVSFDFCDPKTWWQFFFSIFIDIYAKKNFLIF